MCGISGIFSFTEAGKLQLKQIQQATQRLIHRGPDSQGVYQENNIALGHARLSIIDVSSLSNQPFTDASGNYTIVFNGEIFNYLELKKDLLAEGCHFTTQGDVEVLLQLYIREKEKCLSKLKGFFAFAVYDKLLQHVFIARDRFGVKPLYYHFNKNYLCWASELRSVLSICGSAKINKASFHTYLQLNYLAGTDSFIEGIQRLKPGTYITCDKNGSVQVKEYYSLSAAHHQSKAPQQPEAQLKKLVTDAVRLRLLADVPVGSFLSGGIDSTIITGIAAQFSPHINTFSLGFKNNAYFDETSYAEIAARHFKTEHHTFQLSNDDLLAEFSHFLSAIDEPFADSSALNVYILSKLTRQKVKVALSGDGADEVFAGYNKHRAEWMIRNKKGFNLLVRGLAPLLSRLPQSRKSSLSNKSRQIQKYYEGLRSDVKSRYWRWAAISEATEAEELIGLSSPEKERSQAVKNQFLEHLDDNFNSILYSDVHLVLPYDMLTKVDMMSMANGLEVRNPFMDHEVIEYAFKLSAATKINALEQKLILKNTFKEYLPPAILNRPKHGFEIPLQQWFENELRKEIEQKWLNAEYIQAQGIFNPQAIKQLNHQLFNGGGADTAAKVWAILVFSSWWEKNIQRT